jgi:hypothetical protein
MRKFLFALWTSSAVLCLGAGQSVLLWYKQPAEKWVEAMPIGNGRLGAMVFGRIADERIQLNEDTIWSGERRDRMNPGARKAVPEIRRLLFAGKVAEAEALADKEMLAIPRRMPVYQPLGDLLLEFPGQAMASDYRRELDLLTGIVRISYRVGDTNYLREIFGRRQRHRHADFRRQTRARFLHRHIGARGRQHHRDRRARPRHPAGRGDPAREGLAGAQGRGQVPRGGARHSRRRRGARGKGRCGGRWR